MQIINDLAQGPAPLGIRPRGFVLRDGHYDGQLLSSGEEGLKPSDKGDLIAYIDAEGVLVRVCNLPLSLCL